MSTANAAKAKQVLDATAEIDAAKAEVVKLREQLALKEDSLHNLQSANKSLEASLAEKDQQLKAEEQDLVSLQKDLEHRIYEDTIVDSDILRKFRMPETFKRRKLSSLILLTIPFDIFAVATGFPFTKDGENSRGLCLERASGVIRYEPPSS